MSGSSSTVSDDARAVTADALQERGDLRGEFIALQLLEHRGTATRAHTERAQALLSEHGTEWVGDLGQFVQSLQFERGFPNTLALTSAWKASSAPPPGLETIEALKQGRISPSRYAALLRSGAFPALRSVSMGSLAGPRAKEDSILEALEQGAVPNLERFHCLVTPTKWVQRALAYVAATPTIGTLGLALDPDGRVPQGVETLHRLERLELKLPAYFSKPGGLDRLKERSDLTFMYFENTLAMRRESATCVGRYSGRAAAGFAAGWCFGLTNAMGNVKTLEVLNNEKLADALKSLAPPGLDVVPVFQSGVWRPG